MTSMGPREAASHQVQAMLSKLTAYFGVNSASKQLYLFGMGGQPRSVYRELAKLDGISVRLTYHCSPLALKLLLPIAPAFAGVVQVIDPIRARHVFDAIGDSTLFAACVLNSLRGEPFIELVKTKTHPDIIDQWLSSAPEMICYKLDPSNPSSATGMFDWLRLGTSVPNATALEFHELWHSRT